MARLNLGKVLVTLEGEHDSSRAYDKYCEVTSGGSSYVSKKAVPIGTLITDTAFWQLRASKGADGQDGTDGNDGLDAYQPFKGWYSSTSDLNTSFGTPQVGDYAYIKGATANDPVAIYQCVTAGTWADSGRTFNPSNNQEFASGQSLNTVNIVDNLTSSSATDVLSAKQGKELKGQIDALGPKISEVEGAAKDYGQEVTTTKKIIENVVVGKTLYYKFSNAYHTVGCIGFFDSSDTLIGSYIGNVSSGGSAGNFEGTVEVPSGASYLKAVTGGSGFTIDHLYYTDSLVNELANTNSRLDSLSNIVDVIGKENANNQEIDFANPPELNSYVPQNALCFTYNSYKVQGGVMPYMLLYAPNNIGGTINGSLNLVKITANTGELILTNSFSSVVDSNGIAKAYFSSPYLSSYDGANVCLQLTTKSVVAKMVGGLPETWKMKYYNPSDNSITPYNYQGWFTIVSESNIASKDFVKNYVDENIESITSEISVCTPSDDLQAYITANRIVNLVAGTYNISESLVIPSNTKLIGVRGATIFALSGTATKIVDISDGESNIHFENITFVGSTAATKSSMTIANIRSRNGVGSEVGIYIENYCQGITISNCDFKNFTFAGVRGYRTMVVAGNQANNTKIIGCSFQYNYCGIMWDQRSEFNTVVGCNLNNNNIGAYICGGNNSFDSCRFELNGTGFVVYGASGWNDSHGHTTNCSFDHSSGYAICCTGVNNGYTFANCHIFDGAGFVISDSVGVTYVGGIMACKVIVDTPRSAGFNFIHDVLFGSTAAYDTGTIEGSDLTHLSMKNNRFLAQDDYSAINNNY